MKTLRQRGELALTLSLLGIFISLVGIGLGTNLSRNVQQSSSQAQDFFTYKSTLEIRNEAGQVIPWEPDFTWDNAGAGAGLTKGDIKTPPSQLAQVIYDATKAPGVEKSLQGFSATVVIRIPEQKYEIVSAFCEDIYGNTCTKSTVTNDFRTRSKMVISNGAEIKYGVVVRPKTTPQPTSEPTVVPTTAQTTTQVPNSCPISGSECAPRNVEISEKSESSVEVTWDTPKGCTAFNKETNTYWIDVINTGKEYHPGYTVCVGESSDTTDTCKLGKEVLPNRILDTKSFEFTEKKWEENQEYRVNVYTYNPNPSCVSPVSSTTFTYEKETEPTSEPTDAPSNRLVCERGCIYSEGPANSPRCWRGACPADKPECGGGIDNVNNYCTYGGDQCSVRQEVNCKTGENIGTSGETACAKESGSCIPEANCAAEAGGTTRKDLAGCSGRTVCCVLPPKQETIKLSYNLDMKDALLNGSGGSYLKIASWNSVTNGFDQIRTEKNTMSGIVKIPVSLHNNAFGIWFGNLTNLSNQFLFSHSSGITVIPTTINRVFFSKQGGFDDKSFISLLDILQSKTGGYIAADYQKIIDESILNREINDKDSGSKRSQLNTLRALHNPASKNHSFTLNNNYSKNIDFSVVDPSMDSYIVNNYSNHIANMTDDQFKVEVMEDLSDLVKLDIPSGSHKFVLGNMRVGDGKYVFIYGVPFNYVAVSSTGCSNMRSLGLAWRCIFDVDDKDISISIVKKPAREPGDNYPTFASTALNTSDTQYKLSTLTICGSDSCEDVPLSTFRSIEDYESKLGAITHVSCSATADDGAIVNCDPVSLMSNGTHFIQITNDESGDKAQIVTQSQIADVDGDKRVTGLDLANVLAGYSSNESDLNGDGATNSLDLTLILGKIDSEVEYNMRHFERPTLAE